MENLELIHDIDFDYLIGFSDEQKKLEQKIQERKSNNQKINLEIESNIY